MHRAAEDTNRLGNALKDEFLGPGFMNFDISLFKNIPVGGTRRLQLRCELYNAFNHNEWTDVNTTANFDYATGAADQPDSRSAPLRRDPERPAHPARREVHVLSG